MADLAEFVAAQDPVWDQVRRELRAGRKTSHWIWWIFPQLACLGRSPRARHFGLAGLEDAAAYLAHPVLGPRLEDAARLVLAHEGTAPEDILGEVDALKLRASMTLFEAVPGASPTFAAVLDRLYAGTRCPRTRAALAAG
ncbi:DUF1810 domain-containing protein [Rhodosalinus sediminis]|uniref:DUF1810 domain-containing protein n=1 Tax=Rhodosalinus sediminis TaxID=1940533 RepID=UPI0023527666|nr:DUF1810 domain-containing protein [Rhodosalinus sediminis]